MSKNWSLMATHGVVLFYIVTHPQSTMREMSEALSLTERRISQVVRDLAEAGLVDVIRDGRRNTYVIHPEGHFVHPTLAHIPLSHIMEALSSYE